MSLHETQGESGRQSGSSCDLPYLPVDTVEQHVADKYDDVNLGAEVSEEVRTSLIEMLKESGADRERQRELQTKRVKQLENERRRLVRAHLNGAIPVDLLKEEQDRIASDLGEAQRQLAATNVDWDILEANVTMAVGLLADCGQAYRRGGPQVRRRYNQAFFEALYVDEGSIRYTRLAQPFSAVLPAELRGPIEEENPDPHGGGRGFSKNDLVGVEGLEPPTPSL